MPNNIFANVPIAVIAIQTVSFASIGLNSTNILVIHRVGNPPQSWLPTRGINPIDGFVDGDGYIIYPKVDMDLSAYVVPPLPDELTTIQNWVIANFAALNHVHPVADLIPDGEEGQVVKIVNGEAVWASGAGGGGGDYTFSGGIKEVNSVVTLDLDSKTLVSPTISPNWTITQADASTAWADLPTSTSKNITVETGCLVDLSATYQYPTPGSTEAAPTAVSGAWGLVVPAPATPSSALTADNVFSNTSYSVTFTKPKSGLMVQGSQVVVASGNDSTSDSISVSFLYAGYFGYSANSVLNASEIKGLGNKQLQSGLGRLFSGVSASTNEYTFYCYPASYGPLSNVIQNGALPVLGAFTRLADVSITNDAGVAVTMAVYKSNAKNAFTNVTLQFS